MPRKRMPTPLDLPLGPLKLEAAKGYRDSAVEGGLRPFMERWSERVAENLKEEADRQAVFDIAALFRGYERAALAYRQAVVRRAQTAIRVLQRSQKTTSRRAQDLPPLSLTSRLTELHGVSTRRAALLARLGLFTVGDLLTYAPSRWEDRRRITPLAELKPGQPAIVCVQVRGAGATAHKKGLAVTEVPVNDASGSGFLVWFGQPYRATQFPPGTLLLCSGSPRISGGRVSVQVQECEVVRNTPALHMQRVVPVYPTVAGLSQSLLRRLVDQSLKRTDHITEDPLPVALREARQLMPLHTARRALHFPETPREGELARRRLCYEKLLVLQMLLAIRRRVLHDKATAVELNVDESAMADFVSALPFRLTGAQQKALNAVYDDLRSGKPSLRLIHGEVGSGKTVVAAFALYCAARAGRQAAFMAPTEILAAQHRRTLEAFLSPFNIRPALLTGKLRTGDKQRIRAGLRSGDIAVVVGTHALVQETTRFANLAVAVVDEQHRFGVLQRAELVAKGVRPHLFVMTATPIPRTLALVIYGDCDVSVLDELPPGRRPPRTYLLSKRERDQAYRAVREAVAAGRQAFVVCPLIEHSENTEAEAAERRYKALSEGPLKGTRVALLHGRLKPDIAAEIVERFRARQIDVLVCTTIVEVGMDVPSATIMVIEDAERFGLAQLHQLRGRVGRGDDRGTCYLISSSARTEEAWKRLSLLEATTDGFEIAEADLRMRGPGELIGTRQAGLPDVRIANISADTTLVEAARNDAFALLAADPTLLRPEHTELRDMVRRKLPTLLPLLRGD